MINQSDVPAFPVPMVPFEGGFTEVQCTGMTLRDYFAGQALVGMLANPTIAGLVGVDNQDRYLLDNADSRVALCHRAYIIADDMANAAGIPTT